VSPLFPGSSPSPHSPPPSIKPKKPKAPAPPKAPPAKPKGPAAKASTASKPKPAATTKNKPAATKPGTAKPKVKEASGPNNDTGYVPSPPLSYLVVYDDSMYYLIQYKFIYNSFFIFDLSFFRSTLCMTDAPTCRTEKILQSIGFTVAPPPHKGPPSSTTAPPPPAAVSSSSSATTTKPKPKPKSKKPAKEVVVEEDEEMLPVDDDVVMEDVGGNEDVAEGDMDWDGLEAVDVEVDPKVVSLVKDKGKGKAKAVVKEKKEKEKVPKMVELAQEDDGVTFDDDEDEFTLNPDAPLPPGGPPKLHGASKTTGGILCGKAGFSNIADLEKMADEAVTILRKARVFIDPTAPLSTIDRSRPDFVIDVPGPTVKDAVTAIVERDPSYATYTSYAYDFDEDCWSIMGSSLRLGPAASVMSDIFWESAKSKLYIYVLLVCSLLSLFLDG
jgi:hypothetical protein